MPHPISRRDALRLSATAAAAFTFPHVLRAATAPPPLLPHLTSQVTLFGTGVLVMENGALPGGGRWDVIHFQRNLHILQGRQERDLEIWAKERGCWRDPLT